MKRIFRTLVLIAIAITCILQTGYAYDLAQSRPIGANEVVAKQYEVLVPGMYPNSVFASNGSVEKKMINGVNAVKLTANSEGDSGICMGPGDSHGLIDTNFEITNLNYKTAVLKMEVLLVKKASYDDISINFGYCPKSTEEAPADYQYYARRLFNSVKLPLKEVTGWQTVTVPLSKFTSTRTNKYLVPGTEGGWAYEKTDWSKYNILEIKADKDAESRSFSVRNVYIDYSEQLSCFANYGIVNQDGTIVKNISDAAGESISAYIEFNNAKSTEEKASVVVLTTCAGRVNDFNVYPIVFPANTQDTTTIDIGRLPLPEDNMTVQLHLWKSLGSVSSYGEAITLR